MATSTTGNNISVKADWQCRKHFLVSNSSGNTISVDAPLELGGEERGWGPLELLLSGLSGCLGIGVQHTLNKMRQQPEQFSVKAEGVRDVKPPHGLAKIHVELTVNGAVEERRLKRAVQLEVDKYCPAAASLRAEICTEIFLNGRRVQSK